MTKEVQIKVFSTNASLEKGVIKTHEELAERTISQFYRSW
jgi:hypothetical protein